MMNAEFFEAWFEKHLIPTLLKGTKIVMDNASFHRKNRLNTRPANNFSTALFTRTKSNRTFFALAHEKKYAIYLIFQKILTM